MRVDPILEGKGRGESAHDESKLTLDEFNCRVKPVTGRCKRKRKKHPDGRI